MINQNNRYLEVCFAMRKLLSLVAAVWMVLSLSLGVLAVAPKTPTVADFESTLEFSFELSGADVPDVVLSAIEPYRVSTLNASGTFIQSDLASIRFFMQCDVKSGPFSMPFAMWLDLDTSDAANPVYTITVELAEDYRQKLGSLLPELGKQYLHLDYGKLLTADGAPQIGSGANVSAMSSMSKMIEWTMTFTEDLYAEFDVETVGTNHYRYALNNSEIIEICIKAIDAYMDFMDEVMATLLEGQDTQDVEEAEYALASVRDSLPDAYAVLRKLELFPGDGIASEFKVNNEGYLMEQKSVTNLKVDAAEVVDAVVSVYPFLAYGAPEVDIVLKALIETGTTYTNIGTATPVESPVLTDENSVDVGDLIMRSLSYENSSMQHVYEDVKVFYNDEYVDFYGMPPHIVNDRTMVPFFGLGFFGATVAFEPAEDGTATLTYALNGNIVKLIERSSIAIVNGASVDMGVLYSEQAGIVPLRFVAESLGLIVEFDSGEFAQSLNCKLAVFVADKG